MSFYFFHALDKLTQGEVFPTCQNQTGGLDLCDSSFYIKVSRNTSQVTFGGRQKLTCQGTKITSK